MTSERARQANRSNARVSTGPTTLGGKERSAQNARKHGLAAKMSAPDVAAALSNLAEAIAGDLKDNPEIFEAAQSVAEAQLQLLRVRDFKLTSMKADNAAFQRAWGQVPNIFLYIGLSGFAAMERIERYERRALSKRKFAIRRLTVLMNRCTT